MKASRVRVELSQARSSLRASRARGTVSEEQARQIKIDADIDGVIKTIQGLGLESDKKNNRTDTCSENRNLRHNRLLGVAVVMITTFAIAAFAGFVAAYTFNGLNRAGQIRMARLPEIRRAIPVEPEIRRAIPVNPEIRKAIPVHVGQLNRGEQRPTHALR